MRNATQESELLVCWCGLKATSVKLRMSSPLVKMSFDSACCPSCVTSVWLAHAQNTHWLRLTTRLTTWVYCHRLVPSPVGTPQSSPEDEDKNFTSISPLKPRQSSTRIPAPGAPQHQQSPATIEDPDKQVARSGLQRGPEGDKAVGLHRHTGDTSILLEY